MVRAVVGCDGAFRAYQPLHNSDKFECLGWVASNVAENSGLLKNMDGNCCDETDVGMGMDQCMITVPEPQLVLCNCLSRPLSVCPLNIVAIEACRYLNGSKNPQR